MRYVGEPGRVNPNDPRSVDSMPHGRCTSLPLYRSNMSSFQAAGFKRVYNEVGAEDNFYQLSRQASNFMRLPHISTPVKEDSEIQLAAYLSDKRNIRESSCKFDTIIIM